MKNRILLLVLALVMVLTVIPATVIGSLAAEHPELIVRMSSAQVSPGGTGSIDVYFQVPSMPEGTDSLRYWQVALDVPEGVVLENTIFYQNSGTSSEASGFVNVSSSVMGATADLSRGPAIADEAALTADGGVLVATVYFTVADSVAYGEYELSVREIQDIGFLKTGTNDYIAMESSFALSNGVVGKINVVDKDGWTWDVSDDGVLTIGGTGEISETRARKYPWYEFQDSITEIVIGDDITIIGSCAFESYSELTKITFGEKINTLYTDVISYCDALTEIVFRGPITYMEELVACDTLSITSITLTGQTKEEFLEIASENDNSEFESESITWIVGTSDEECMHKNTAIVAGVAPTCTETGLTEGSVCADCGIILTAQTTVPATGHATIENGRCTVCDECMHETIVLDTGSEPTCTTDGWAWQFCDNCGDVLEGRVTLPATGHDFVDRVCTACGEVEKPVVVNGTIEPYGTGFENWSNQTQLLIMIPNMPWAQGSVIDWELTFSDSTTTKVVTMRPSTCYAFSETNVLYRFEPCLAEGENQFIPVSGTPYSVSIKGYSDGELVYVGTPLTDAAWTLPADQEPIVPQTPKWPVKMTLEALFGKIENYGNKEEGTYATCMIVGWSNTDGEAMSKVFTKVKDGTYAVKVIITDETTGKTYTIEKYAFDHGGDGALELYGDWFLRIIPGDYGIVLETDHAYTVEYVITENGEVRYNAASEKGAFAGGNDAFMSEGAVIPDEIPHTYEEAETPVEPEDPVDPPVEPPVEPEKPAVTITVQGVINAMKGDTVDVQVLLGGNPGIAFLALTPVYDTSVLTLVSVSNGEILSDMDQGVNLVFSSNSDSYADGMLVTLTFVIAEDAPAGEYAVSLTFRECYNGDTEDVACEIYNAEIAVIDFLYGDANDDRTVNGQDLILLRKYLAGYNYDTGAFTTVVGEGADVNGDGVINGKDVLLLRKYMANYDYETGSSIIVLGPNAGCMHIEVIDPAIAPTCTTTGLTEGSHCSDCKEVMKEQTVVAATGHTYTDGVCFCGDVDESYTPEVKYSEGLEYTLSNDGTFYIVTGMGTCSDLDLVIPPVYNDLPVKEIGEEAFFHTNYDIKSVSIPEGVSVIGNEAFRYCYALETVDLPESVIKIGAYAFCHCPISEIDLPSNLEIIGDHAFYLCENLEKIEIPKTVTYIGQYAFWDCVALTQITLEEGLKSITPYAFYGCPELTEIAIPSSVESIGRFAFYGCGKIKTLDLPAELKELGLGAFVDCASLESIVIPKNITSIENRTFDGCTALVSVILHDGITSIGNGAFYGCESLVEITMPEGLVTVGESAFANCKSLKSLEFPKTVQSFSKETSITTFYGCSSMETLTIHPDNPYYVSYKNCIVEKATQTVLFGVGVCELPDDGSVGRLSNHSLCDLDKITSIIIPEGVVCIESFVFYDCNNLKEIVIPGSVETIGSSVLQNCNSLETIIFTGTEQEWESISKGTDWDYGTGEYVVICSDTVTSEG